MTIAVPSATTFWKIPLQAFPFRSQIPFSWPAERPGQRPGSGQAASLLMGVIAVLDWVRQAFVLDALWASLFDVLPQSLLPGSDRGGSELVEVGFPRPRAWILNLLVRGCQVEPLDHVGVCRGDVWAGRPDLDVLGLVGNPLLDDPAEVGHAVPDDLDVSA